MIPFHDEPRPERRGIPYGTWGLMVVNILVFLYMVSLGPNAEAFVLANAVRPYELTTGQDLPPPAPISPYLNIITAMFMHGSILHIAGNMLFLWVFGDNVEDAMGHVRFLGFYLLGGLGATFLHVAFDPFSRVPALGASGAIAAVLAAYLRLFPEAPVRTFLLIGPVLLPVRIKALILIGFWIVLQVVLGIVGLSGPEEGGVAYWAHVGGFLTGLALVSVFSRRPTPAA